jgi:ubiquinone/menaquinone biosynthesis C-methylase UbiE
MSCLQNQRHDLEVLTPSDLVESATCPIIDPAGSAERLRHAFLARLLANALPQLTPPRMVEGGVARVLDLASCAGDWALAVALAHPDCEIVGVDRCRAMVDDASERAAREALPNVSFRHLDVLAQPLPFPNQRFDLVHASFLASFLPDRESWRSLLRECVRVTRPGGAIRLVECAGGGANSHACHTLCAAYQQALLHAGLRPALPYFSIRSAGSGWTGCLPRPAACAF